MKNGIVRKGIVLGIILLFVGAGFVICISGSIEEKSEVFQAIDGTVGDFWCDAGGPYELWGAFQFLYIIPGVRFHGSAGGGDPPYFDWLWDFGDSNTSIFQNPIHFYERPGLYNVSLTVRDSGGNIAFDQTKAYLIGNHTHLKISIKSPSIRIKAEIENPGEYNATYVNWTIVVKWGPLQIFEKVVGNGTIERLAPCTSEPIESGYFFGFGRIHIVISAEPENIPGRINHFAAFKIGPFLFGVH